MQQSLTEVLSFLAPWKFSFAVTFFCCFALYLYIRGALIQFRDGQFTGLGRSILFVSGVLSIYSVMQTRLDYWSLHSFWMHRAQHGVLHHLGPFLVALSAPAGTLFAGSPDMLREKVLVPISKVDMLRKVYAIVQQPVVATSLFLGLMGYWLVPSNQFNAMLSDTNYSVMNWGILVEGLLFWWMMLEPSHKVNGQAPGAGMRILLQWVVIMTLIVMGYYIVYSDHTLYPVYAICGRLWPISPMTDQEYGGMITWMPTSIISILAAVVLVSRWMRESDQKESTAPETSLA